MNLHQFHSESVGALPDSVRKSLNTSGVLANVRTENDVLYCVINYPYSQTENLPICIAIQHNRLDVYTNNTLEINTGEDVTDLFTDVLSRYEYFIHELRDAIDDYEHHIDAGISKDQVQSLFSMKRRLIHYASAIRGFRDVFEYCVGSDVMHAHTITDSDAVNIRIEIDQLDETITMQIQIIDALVSVSDALFTNHLNVSMKRLAVITLVLSIPTLVSSFFGMNIDLPFQNHPLALAIVMLFSTSLTVVTLYLLKRTKIL